MITTALTAAAANLARQAHAGEVDRTAKPAIEHYFAVAERMETEEETCAALLNSALGTGRISLAELRNAGFSEPMCEALEVLERKQDEEFFAFIERVAQNPLASKVKRADLVQRVEDMESYVSLTGMDRRRRTSCLKAIDILDGVDSVAFDGLFESQHHQGKLKVPVPAAPQPPLY